MPCILKLRIIAARNLCSINSSTGLADPYVQVRLGPLEPMRTLTLKDTLNPVWNHDFRIEVTNDTILQDDPLELKVFDYIADSADNAFGTVMIDLNPLLSISEEAINGWMSIYDTIKGRRGELCIQAKLEFFGDSNPFKESSAGVKFYVSDTFPDKVSAIVGFADECITETDPDYHWIDRFRTSRSSNEASHRILQQLSCRLRRQIGHFAIEMGGNAILGYHQEIDIETWSQTITIRGYGTVVWIEENSKDIVEDSDYISLPFESINLITITELPFGLIKSLNGIVSARIVKSLEESRNVKIRNNWLLELREDIRSNAKLIGCNAILGYNESVAFIDDVYVLSAQGTACRLQRKQQQQQQQYHNHNQKNNDQEDELDLSSTAIGDSSKRTRSSCAILHYSLKKKKKSPMVVKGLRCRMCARRLVPEILFTTCKLPEELSTVGNKYLIEAYVCRQVRKSRESDCLASATSSLMPFVEYDLHRQLLFKLKFLSYNAIFNLKFNFVMNENALAAVASGEAVFLSALPMSQNPLKITRNIEINDDEDLRLFELQQGMSDQAQENYNVIKELIRLKSDIIIPQDSELDSKDISSSSSSSSDSSIVEGEGDSDNDSIKAVGSGINGSSSGSSSSSSDSEENATMIQIDDEADEELLLLLSCTKGQVVASGNTIKDGKLLIKSCVLDTKEKHFHYQLAKLFKKIFEDLQKSTTADLGNQHYCLSGIKHQLCLGRNNQIQVTTMCTLVSSVARVVTSSLSSSSSSSSSSHDDNDGEEEMSLASSPRIRANLQRRSRRRNYPIKTISFSFKPLEHNFGAVIVQLFREVKTNEFDGDHSKFINDFVFDAHEIIKDITRSYGGNSINHITVQPIAVFENFKDQFHAVIIINGDVINCRKKYLV